MFEMVLANGIKRLSKVDFTSQANLLIIACSLGMGLGVTTVPEMFAQLPRKIRYNTKFKYILIKSARYLPSTFY